jgi:2-oxoglutarate dehydrogenase E2 component (dihydrolipoamide succinyltransferase)
VAPLVPGSGDRVEQLNNIRRLTGDAMVASKASAPHAITIVEVDYEGVERVRRALRADFKEEEGFSLTYLPFISRAVVDALHEFPHMNASMGDGSVVLHDEVHLSIAVDLNYQGLLAPVVRDAHDKRLRAIARDIHELAERARSKKLSPDDLAGGTFTLSNSGSYGTLIVVPIINQPQVAILGTGALVKRPMVVKDPNLGEIIAVRDMMYLSMSYDHRLVDGAVAARFLSFVKARLEEGAFEL